MIDTMDDIRPPASPSDPVRASVDEGLRLVDADPPLAALNAAAGGRVGAPLALPALAELVEEAHARGRRTRRTVRVADDRHDYELDAVAAPGTRGVSVRIEGWRERPVAGARFGQRSGTATGPDFSIDARLRIVSLRKEIAERFHVDLAELPRPFTELVNLLPTKDGRIPMLDALSRGEPFARQRATVRALDFQFAFSGTPRLASDGAVEQYEMTVHSRTAPERAQDGDLDDTLRSPLAKIIESADRIVDRSDGPLRSDYADYAGDIATAGRHLLAVIKSMGDSMQPERSEIDLVALSTEAMAMASAEARTRGVELDLEDVDDAILALGEPRGIKQILVNIIGNAVAHSPDHGTVAVVFDHDGDEVSVTVADQGPGIARADQSKVFDNYERLGRTGGEGAGLGLAISRRLARSMRGDIVLESAPGEGARFTLILPAA